MISPHDCADVLCQCRNRRVSNGRTVALDLFKTKKKGKSHQQHQRLTKADRFYLGWGEPQGARRPATTELLRTAGIINGSGKSIPRGTFLCVYAGEVVTWKEAEYV